MNRRNFNRRCAATILGLSAVHALAERFNYPWNLGIITDQVDLDLSRVLSSFYAKYQLRWAEIRNLKFEAKERYVYADSTPDQLRQIRRQLDDAGVKLSVLDTAVYKVELPGTVPVAGIPAYVNPELSEFGRQLDDLKRAADTAHALGSERVRIFTFRRVAEPAAIFDRVVEQLQRAIAIAKQEDITLLVENEYDCNTATAAETARLFKAITDRRLMHNWDPCNAYEIGEQPFPKAWDQLDHSRISHIHLKDAAGKEWKPVGAGEIDFVGQFQALKRIGYSGTLSLETRYKDARQDLYASSVESM
ncbi:MAG: sugar phosphate isomerase/epimerase family protein, partial [Bryobacteraceae bacterium]